MNKELGYVRVMRSHNYNQFEVCLPLADDKSPDEVRKECARLVDKAVRQYDQHINAETLADKLRGDETPGVPDFETQQALAAATDTRTIRQKALVARYQEKDWLANREYRHDYEDDAPEFDHQTTAF